MIIPLIEINRRKLYAMLIMDSIKPICSVVLEYWSTCGSFHLWVNVGQYSIHGASGIIKTWSWHIAWKSGWYGIILMDNYAHNWHIMDIYTRYPLVNVSTYNELERSNMFYTGKLTNFRLGHFLIQWVIS